MCGIYKITNTINNKSYIGQSRHIEQRWKEHQTKKPSSSSLISQAIHKYGNDNFIYEVLEECNIDDLNEKEIFWISYYDTFNNGYNLTRGGDRGFYYDIEAIYEDYLKTENIAQTAKNIGCHKTTVRNIIHEFGIVRSDLCEEKPVEKIDPATGKIIATYACMQDAADAMKITHGAITMAVNGKNQSCGGYYWRLQGDNKEFPTSPPKKWKQKVAQLDCETEEIIAIFDSAAEAGDFLGKGRKNGGSQIISVCNGKRKSAYGYKWKKID